MKHLFPWIAILGIASFSSCASTGDMEKAQESGQESEESIFYDEYEPYELGPDSYIWDDNDTIF